MRRFYGYNGDGQFLIDIGAFNKSNDVLIPPAMVILNQPEIARMEAARYPSTQVIHRRIVLPGENWTQDGDDWKRFSPDQYIERLKREQAHGCWHNILNEPGARGDDLKAKVDWLCRTIRKGVKDPDLRGFVVDNVSTGFPESEGFHEITDGTMDPLWETIAEFPDRVDYGMHLYGMLVINVAMAAFFNVWGLQFPDQHIGVYKPWISPQVYQDEDTVHYHFGKENLIFERCDLKNIPAPGIILTEVSFDELPDYPPALRQFLHNEAGGECSGVRTLDTGLRRIYGDAKSTAVLIVDELEHITQVLNPKVKAGCLYCFSFENSRWGKLYNYGARPDVMRELERRVKDAPQLPPPPPPQQGPIIVNPVLPEPLPDNHPEWHSAQIGSRLLDVTALVRYSPSTASKVVDRVTSMLVAGAIHPAGYILMPDGIWFPVKVRASGYIRADVLWFELVEATASRPEDAALRVEASKTIFEVKENLLTIQNWMTHLALKLKDAQDAANS